MNTYTEPTGSPLCIVCGKPTDGLASRPTPAGRVHSACPTPEDLRAIYSSASRYLRALYADQPSPHATKDNAVRLARIAEALHANVNR